MFGYSTLQISALQLLFKWLKRQDKIDFYSNLWTNCAQIPLISWTDFIDKHKFRGHTALLAMQYMSTFLVEFKKVFQEQQIILS